MKIQLGGIWLNDCRIPYGNKDDSRIDKEYKWESKAEKFGEAKNTIMRNGWNNTGRFPANLLVSDDILNDGNTTTAQGGPIHAHSLFIGWQKVEGEKIKDRICDSGSYSRYFDLDKWFEDKL